MLKNNNCEAVSLVNLNPDYRDSYYMRTCTNEAWRFQEQWTSWLVVDNATGLMWEKLSSMWWWKTWNEAKNHCNNLVKWWYDDWRMPNITELRTLRTCWGLDIRYPFTSGFYYSSTPRDPEGNNFYKSEYFNLNGNDFYFHKHRPYWINISNDVLCVRGNEVSNVNQFSFVTAYYLNLTKDAVSRLIWDRNGTNYTMDYYAAENYCASKTIDWYSGFRLPTMVELESIFKYDQGTMPKVNDWFFRIKWESYWTKTLYHPNTNMYAWVWSFYDWRSLFAAKNTKHRVMCVKDY